MINTFILEGELVGIHENSIDLLIDNKMKVNVLASPSMIEIINEVEAGSPFVGIQGKIVQDEEQNLKIFMEKFSFVSLEQVRPEQAKKHSDKSR